ncbi:GNAT family N-acetyltransferase [Halobacterium bonnevillei]|uniref:GNAT family N-acetyltransferase n=1 Tax=Halobacterium bonnevillei TaxID=2692200 RepID=A0A6B0SI74_9EURY|nr:N-acetyltransferase [Halobacterium bonnevillei]MXR20797.1 GNAT family N-acetyltransferase [Halobacterium bonnevillei]
MLEQTRAYFETEDRRQTAYLLLSPNGRDAVVAFGVIREDGYLTLFTVAPDHRRQGLGTRLMAALTDDYDAITLHTRATNREAIEFCEHTGFSVQRRIEDYYRGGTDALELGFERDRSN